MRKSGRCFILLFLMALFFVHGLEKNSRAAPNGVGKDITPVFSSLLLRHFDYYVGLGDSITFGSDDDDPSDDTSRDGRNSGGGYTPILNDLLTNFKGYPHTVVNEGVPGDKSVDGVLAISAVLARHPDSSVFLVQYGTNDAGTAVPSGLGLSPADGENYTDTFKYNMQQIIDAIIAAGKQVCLAKIHIALGSTNTGAQYPDPIDDGLKNIDIREYNQVIDELINDPLNNIVVTPPDFYTYFSSRYETEYNPVSNYHPNGIGYRSMADLWFQALTQ